MIKMKLIGLLFIILCSWLPLFECQVVQYNPYAGLSQQVPVPQQFPIPQQQFSYGYPGYGLQQPQQYFYPYNYNFPNNYGTGISPTPIQYGIPQYPAQYGMYNPYSMIPPATPPITMQPEVPIPVRQTVDVPLSSQGASASGVGLNEGQVVEIINNPNIGENGNVDQLLSGFLQQAEISGKPFHGEQYFWGKNIPLRLEPAARYRRVHIGKPGTHHIKMPFQVITPGHFEMYKYQ